MISAQCNGLSPPQYISLNLFLKSSSKYLTNNVIEGRGQEVKKWTVSVRRLLTTHRVPEVSDEFCTSKKNVIVNAFRNGSLCPLIVGSFDSM